MIGNDIVDLNLAKTQSNWKRRGYLNKIFTENEQNLIFESENPTTKVWNLWSRKEAAYKIFNRSTKIRVFNPKKFDCFDISIQENETTGKVIFDDKTFFTKTIVSADFINSVAMTDENQKYSNEIFDIELYSSFIKNKKIVKDQFGIPYIFDEETLEKKIISIAHHGSFCSYMSVM